MSKFRLLVAAAAAVLIAVPAMAQNTTTMTPSSKTPSGMMANDPMKDMSASDRYRATWVFYKLDDREMNRMKMMGLSETDIRGVANIALRSGLPLDHLVRQMVVGGIPMSYLAMMYGVSPAATAAEIPCMGMGSPAMSMGMMH